jgi:ATP adenylyltransferase/5',5'''-P-1,P-4-tetraphosphate phosphorylase II
MAKTKKEQSAEDVMAKNEKHNDGSMSGLKKTIIGTVSTLVVGGGTFLMSYLQKPKENDTKNQPQTQQSININLPTQQQAASGKTVIIKEKGAAGSTTTAKPVEQPKPKKKEGDEFKEKPAQW